MRSLPSCGATPALYSVNNLDDAEMPMKIAGEFTAAGWPALRTFLQARANLKHGSEVWRFSVLAYVVATSIARDTCLTGSTAALPSLRSTAQ